jgi:hypothetical protein
LRSFKVGDLVDIKEMQGRHRKWTGPHKLIRYKYAIVHGKSAARFSIDIKGKVFERWLIKGENPFVRKHISD